MIENKGQQIEANNNAAVNEVIEFENKPLFGYSTINNSQLILNDLFTKPDTRPTFIELIKSSRKLVGNYQSLNPDEVIKYKERISFLSDFLTADEAQRDCGFHAGSAFNIINGLTKGLMDPLRKGETDFKNEFERASGSVVDFINRADVNELGFPATVALKRLMENNSLVGFQFTGPVPDDPNDIRNKINEIKLNANKFSIFNTKDSVKAENRAIEFINSFAVSAPITGREYKTGKTLDTVEDKVQELKMSLSFTGIEKRNNFTMQILEEAIGYSGITKLHPEDFSKICLTYRELFDEYYDKVKIPGHNGSTSAIIPSEHLDNLKTRADQFLQRIDNLVKTNPDVAQNIFATDSLYQVLKRIGQIDDKTKEIKADSELKNIDNNFFKNKEHYFVSDVGSSLSRLFNDNFKSPRPMDQRFTFDTLATQSNSSIDKFWDYIKFLDYSTTHAKDFPNLVIRSSINVIENLLNKHVDYLSDSNPENILYSKNSQHLQTFKNILSNFKKAFYSSNPDEKVEDPSQLIIEKIMNIENIIKTKASANPELGQILNSTEI